MLLTLIGIAGALGGSLVTLLTTTALARRTESRTARRAFYVELLTLLASRREYLREAAFDPSASIADIPKERIDSLNALLLLDATSSVRAKAGTCFNLLSRFGVSRTLNVPVDVDEQGFYHHRFEQMQDQPQATQDMLIRMALGKIFDEFSDAVDSLAAQMQREIHGGTPKALPTFRSSKAQ